MSAISVTAGWHDPWMDSDWQYEIVNIQGILGTEPLTVTSIQKVLQGQGDAGWELIDLRRGEELGLRPLDTGGGTTLGVPALLATFKRPRPRS